MPEKLSKLVQNKKMLHVTAFKSNASLIQKYGVGSAHLVWVMGLYLDYPNLDELASEALTDGSDDKKIDFIKLDTENKKLVFAQGYYTERKVDSAPANKASDLNTAAAWLISGDLDHVPEQLRDIIGECRSAIQKGDLEEIDLLYVHNLPESVGVTRELKTVADHLSAVLPKSHNISVIYKELGLSQTEELFTEQSSEIVIRNQIICPAEIEFEESGPNWSAAILSIPGDWLREQFTKEGDKLFSANYRGFLGVTKRRKINSGIKNTAEKQSTNFWAYNNGITILTLGYTKNKDKTTTLNGISIINGAQTTGSIGTLEKSIDLSQVKVLARLIKCMDSKTVEEIIKYNNTQNKITTWDKFSNDSIQKTIQEEFERYGHNYNLKRGFSNNEGEVGIENVAQPLIALQGNYAAANQGKNELFDSDPLYKATFENAKARHILFAYCVNRAIDTIRYDLKQKKGLNQTIALEEKQLFLLRNLRFKFFFISVFGACLEALLGQRAAVKELGFSPAAAKQSNKPINELIVEILPIVNMVLIYTATTINGTDFSDILQQENPVERISRQVSGILLATFTTTPNPAIQKFREIVLPQ